MMASGSENVAGGVVRMTIRGGIPASPMLCWMASVEQSRAWTLMAPQTAKADCVSCAWIWHLLLHSRVCRSLALVFARYGLDDLCPQLGSRIVVISANGMH